MIAKLRELAEKLYELVGIGLLGLIVVSGALFMTGDVNAGTLAGYTAAAMGIYLIWFFLRTNDRIMVAGIILLVIIVFVFAPGTKPTQIASRTVVLEMPIATQAVPLTAIPTDTLAPTVTAEESQIFWRYYACDSNKMYTLSDTPAIANLVGKDIARLTATQHGWSLTSKHAEVTIYSKDTKNGMISIGYLGQMIGPWEDAKETFLLIGIKTAGENGTQYELNVLLYFPYGAFTDHSMVSWQIVRDPTTIGCRLNA